MSRIGRGIGVIFVVCSYCGFIFHNYSIGDKNNKAKFSGVPTPSKALSGYDGLVCPGCGRQVGLKPTRIQVMHWKKFVELYDIVEKPLPKLRPSRTIIDEHMRSMHDLSKGLSDTAVGVS